MLVSVIVENDFKKRLQSDFDAYVKKGQFLSLRSFAKKLDLAPSTLHQYLSGKYFPSEKNLKKIGVALNWSSTDMEMFLKEYSSLNQKRQDTLILDLTKDPFFPLSRMVFKILALRDLGPLKTNFDGLLVCLNLKPQDSQALKAILEELGSRNLIQWDGKTLTFKKKVKFIVQDRPAGNFLEFQKESLQQLQSSLTNVPKEKRLIMLSQIRIDPNSIQNFSKDLNQFTAKIKAKYGYSGPSGEIYQFIGALIPFE